MSIQSSIGSVMQSLFGGPQSNPTALQPGQRPPVPGSQPAVNPGPTGDPTPNQPFPGTQNNPVTAPNGVVPNNTPAPNTPNQEPQSPLDAFKDIWNTPQPDPKNPNPADQPLFNVDPKKVFEQASKVDFTKQISPELLAKVAAGGQDGVAAMLAIVNTATQNAYGQSTLSTLSLMEKALAKQAEKQKAELPGLLKTYNVNANLSAENPILNHPSIQPLREAMSTMLSAKNPTASETEIQRTVVEYFNTLGQQFAPKKELTPAEKRAQQWNENANQDFSGFLS
jgi:hypothetical protein